MGISTVPMTDQQTRAKVRSLEAANETMLGVYDQKFFVHRVLINPRGVELHATMAMLKRLLTDPVFGKIAKYRAIYANGTLPERSRIVKEEQLEVIERLFAQICTTNTSDDASRLQKLTLFFSAMVLEHNFFKTLLPDSEQTIRQFAADDSLVPASESGSDVHSPAFLARRALAAFAIKYLRSNFSRMLDGANEVLESSDTFAEECVNAYMSQLPAYLPIELAATTTTTTTATTTTTKTTQ
jgi:hypothetical protein